MLVHPFSLFGNIHFPHANQPQEMKGAAQEVNPANSR
jgi:hypothetical protein